MYNPNESIEHAQIFVPSAPGQVVYVSWNDHLVNEMKQHHSLPG